MLSVAQWIVTLLFFFIEILPVTAKVLLNIGPLSPYETLLKTEEDIITDQPKLTRVIPRQDAERESDTQIAIDEHMRQREGASGRRPTSTSPRTWRPSSTSRSRSGAGKSRPNSASTRRR